MILVISLIMKGLKMKKKLSKFDLLNIILFIFPLMIGLEPMWSLFLLALMCIGGIIYKAKKNKKIILPKGKYLVFLCIYIFSFILVSLWAVDKGMTILAFFKNFTVLLFVTLILQYDLNAEKREKYFETISYSGVASIALSLVLYLFGLSTIFYGNRFQGIFNYANSFGLFLLIGVIVQLNHKKIDLKTIIITLILLIGIILTNSRAIIILTVLSFIIMFFLNKDNLKRTIPILVCFIVLFGTFYLLSNVEKRVNPEMFESSEFLTRLLYYKDAINMIKVNPFGYGYEGWYYKQTEIQTALYDTKYVHSSILQVALDVGIVPLLSLVILLLMTFFDKKQSAINRIIMIIILGHSLIDIDLEFMIFIFLIAMMINFEEFELKKYKTINYIFVLIGILYSVLFISDFSYAVKDYDTAYNIIPFHTEALQEELYGTADPNKQLELAKRILPLNKNVSGAYEALSNELQKENKYVDALEYENRRLQLNKYKIYNYILYTDFLSEGIQYYNKEKDYDNLKLMANELIELEAKRDKVVEESNPLFIKTQHYTDLEFPDELKEYVDRIKNMLDNL